jgi:sporulation protein YlmC with PRC-barrel domain
MRPSSLVKCTTPLLAATLIMAAGAVAQDRPGQRPGVGQDRPMQPMHPLSQQEVLHHVDDIHGKEVRNLQGERIGTINSLIVDVEGGKAEFAVLASGGWLGIGENLYAVPWQSFELRPLTDALFLNVTEEQLERAPQFDPDALTRFSDRQWTQELHQFYGSTPHGRTGDRPMRERMDRPDEGRERTPQRQEQPRRRQQRDPDDRYDDAMPGRPQFLRSTAVIGMRVQDTAGENLGRINDLAMDLHTAEIPYAVMAFGGVLGIAESNLALPWQSFDLRGVERNDLILVLDMTREQLQQAPEYDRNWLPGRQHMQWHESPQRRPMDRPDRERQRDRQPTPRQP